MGRDVSLANQLYLMGVSIPTMGRDVSLANQLYLM